MREYMYDLICSHCSCGMMPAFSAVDIGVCGEAGFIVDGVLYEEDADEGPGLGEGS